MSSCRKEMKPLSKLLPLRAHMLRHKLKRDLLRALNYLSLPLLLSTNQMTKSLQPAESVSPVVNEPDDEESSTEKIGSESSVSLGSDIEFVDDDDAELEEPELVQHNDVGGEDAPNRQGSASNESSHGDESSLLNRSELSEVTDSELDPANAGSFPNPATIAMTALSNFATDEFDPSERFYTPPESRIDYESVHSSEKLDKSLSKLDENAHSVWKDENLANDSHSVNELGSNSTSPPTTPATLVEDTKEHKPVEPENPPKEKTVYKNRESQYKRNNLPKTKRIRNNLLKSQYKRNNLPKTKRIRNNLLKSQYKRNNLLKTKRRKLT
ncbi:hypothetical protein MACK_003671 [Theileria orientalis]|uniref:Uncharacterized protein n=1 Tax=Theileria orientalis TaxID=68886 RepID=A0A976SJK5_THEOR|nr:hypothetical protein MACK_003671 [Theileria orientalis]